MNTRKFIPREMVDCKNEMKIEKLAKKLKNKELKNCIVRIKIDKDGIIKECRKDEKIRDIF